MMPPLADRKKPAGLGLFVFLGLLLFIFLLSRDASAQAGGQTILDVDHPTILLPEEALQISGDLALAFPESSSNGRLDASLADLATQVGAGSQQDVQGLRIENGLVQVRLETADDQLDRAASLVEESGGIVSSTSDVEPLIQAWIPLQKLQDVAADPAVAFVGRPAQLVELDVAAQSEGLVAMNGQAWHQAGYRGQGVRIAIIDSGFAGYTSLLGSQFTGNVSVKNFVDGQGDREVDGTSPHGTACAEIVADIAPAAHLFLLKISTDLDLEQAVDYAISQGVDVISTSVGWYNLTPGDGTGYFSDLVDKARGYGIVWATAAGNDRESHWGGLFHDPDGNGFHNFSGSQEVNYFGPGNGNGYLLNPGFLLPVFLRWDDWTFASQDYALHVVRYNNGSWEIIASSDRLQLGFPGQRPTESVVATTSGGPAVYGYAIQRRNSSRNVNMEIFTPKMPRLDELVYERSLANLADARNAITMGAIDSRNPYSHESYSSQGPTNGSGGALFGGIIKPDFSGYAGVSTESYGPGVFAGTSAAAPHAAGAAALVRDVYDHYSAQQVLDFLISRAIDQGPFGMDTLYGHGRLYLGSPPDPTAGLNFHSYMPTSFDG